MHNRFYFKTCSYFYGVSIGDGEATGRPQQGWRPGACSPAGKSGLAADCQTWRWSWRTTYLVESTKNPDLASLGPAEALGGFSLESPSWGWRTSEVSGPRAPTDQPVSQSASSSQQEPAAAPASHLPASCGTSWSLCSCRWLQEGAGEFPAARGSWVRGCCRTLRGPCSRCL